MDALLRKRIHARSDGRCEAVVCVNNAEFRCHNPAQEIHHMLTKARGGAVLDNVHETYHLIHLCHNCHAMCDGADAYDGGMLIDGYMTTEQGRPFYRGTDEYLQYKYGEENGN